MTDPSQDEALDLLAAELALGLLDPAEHRAAVLRTSRDAAFAVAVARWEGLAAELTDDGRAGPRPSLWAEISARLPANDGAPGRVESGQRNPWVWATALATAAALALGAIALRPAAPPVTVAAAPEPPLVTVLRSEDGGSVLVATFDRRSGRLVTAPAGLNLAGHDAELWVIPPGGAPHSLGVISAAAPQWRGAPGGPVTDIAPGATLAVSLEPRGGSRTGKPTGAIALTGVVARPTT